MAKQKINKLQGRLQTTLNDTTIPDDDCLLLSANLRERINTTRQSLHNSICDCSHLKMRVECESPTSRLWAQSGKDKKPRDSIVELLSLDSTPEAPTYINHSDRMAELACNYYEDLQSRDLAPQDTHQKETAEVLSKISTSLPDEERVRLDQDITTDEVHSTLSSLPNGKAAGLNGLPYEFWKWLDSIPIKSSNNDPFKLTDYIQKVFIDVQHHGVDLTMKFSEGWICPLYKKKDRHDIANYWPITLLNSDYKLFTKILALRLAHSAPSIIHEDQAGFIPGRLITDQIRLTQMILHYAEAVEENGVIIALDQEKAYDKIMHDYLWLALDKYGIPTSFINTIRSLYETAESLVIINGERSSFFQVTRGVWQGDPLSCLLFDIAIEPLAKSIWKSDLTGFTTDHINKTIVSLFTDDITVYLSENDNVETLYSILSKWCKASGAKFNIEKMEVIPIENKEYRDQVVRTARTNPASTTFDQNIHIAKDGQAVWILGAWIGNNIDESAIWSPILEKIDLRLQWWDQKKLSIEGRKVIIQWTVGAMLQYLTCAQGMPKSIESALNKHIQKFIWDGEGKSNAAANLRYAPISKGGKSLLHLKYRNEAIEIVWLKKLLMPPHKWSTWTAFANALLAHFYCKTPVVKTEPHISYFLQS